MNFNRFDGLSHVLNKFSTPRSVRTQSPDNIYISPKIPMYEMISLDTGLTEGFHVTIRFDGEYKRLSRKEVKTACMERLHHMNIPLGTAYSNPIDIGINTVTRN